MSIIQTVTAAQLREVDRIMVDELHIELPQMMEKPGAAWQPIPAVGCAGN